MNIATLINSLTKPSCKIFSARLIKELGLTEHDLDDLVKGGFLKVNYFIVADGSDDNIIYLNDDDLHNRIITGELINPESGKGHYGEVFFEYENLFKISLSK